MFLHRALLGGAASWLCAASPALPADTSGFFHTARRGGRWWLIAPEGEQFLWHQKTGKPVLLADHAAVISHPDGLLSHDGAGYARMLETLRQIPGCIGYHLCGTYLRNETRQRALRDAFEKPDSEALKSIQEANRAAAEWMARETE